MIADLFDISSVILFGVTARRTAASVFRFLKIYRQLPISKRHGRPDKLRGCACVGLMARAAGSPMRRFVDVNKMKIAIAITESGFACRVLFRRERSVVTTETEIVI